MSILQKALSRAFIGDEDYDENVTQYYERKREQGSSLAVKEVGKIFDISVADIRTNPAQPRKFFAPDKLTELAKSISQDGIIQPLSVRRVEGGFELISGERRLRAAKMAGMKSVPCIVINADSKRSAVMALIENIQRAQLGFFEEAQAMEELIRRFGLKQEELAVRLGSAQSTVANKLRLLRLSQEERDIITDTGLSERHARALLKIDDEDMRKSVLLKAVNGGWTVNQLEGQIKKMQEQEIRRQNIRKGAVVLRDVRMFFNTVNKAVDVMRLAGVEADTKRIDHEDHIEYIIKISSKNLKNTPISVP
ncbi:MAG: ParB/RepB/Spo0J family partition protein [Ruminococcus sp.]|nr:ParB/RepB/Spo0J family partition protein [Ruminococcus sp.]